MAKLTDSEVQAVVKALTTASEFEQKAAIASKGAFVEFLKKIGLTTLAHKIADWAIDAFNWLVETIGDWFS